MEPSSTFEQAFHALPQKRITAEDASRDEWFEESLEPIDPEMFPTLPAKSECDTVHGLGNQSVIISGLSGTQLQKFPESFRARQLRIALF